MMGYPEGIHFETALKERVMMGYPEGIHFETALKERVMMGYPEGILSFKQIKFLFFYQDSENPCFYSNNQTYKAGDSEKYSCKKEDK